MPQQKKNPPRTTLLARYQNIVLYTECIRLLEVVWRQVWGKLPRCECSLVSGGQSEPRERERGGGGVWLWKWPWYERPWSSKRPPPGYWETNSPATRRRIEEGELRLPKFQHGIPPSGSQSSYWSGAKDETLTWTALWVSTSEVCTVKQNEKIPASAAMADWTYSPEFSFSSLMKSAKFLGGSACVHFGPWGDGVTHAVFSPFALSH